MGAILQTQDKSSAIKEVKICGFGWDFSGSVAEVNLIGK